MHNPFAFFSSLRRTAVPVVAACLVATALVSSTRAGDFQEAVGFSPNHLFESGAFGERVDVTNGNLLLTVPIGPTYQVNDLSYGVVLTYNSKIWDYGNTNLTSESARNPFLKTPASTESFGLGWTYHEGRLFLDPNASYTAPEKVIYEAPDGARHSMFLDASTSPDYYYSKDSSYLRARAYTVSELGDPNRPDMRVWKVWEPDGSARLLGYLVGSGQEPSYFPSPRPIDSPASSLGWYTIRRESALQKPVGSADCAATDDLFLPGLTAHVNGHDVAEVPCNHVELFYKPALQGAAAPPARSLPVRSQSLAPLRFIRDSVGREIEFLYGSNASPGAAISIDLPGLSGDVRYDLRFDQGDWIQGPLADAPLYIDDGAGGCATAIPGPDAPTKTQADLLRQIVYPYGYSIDFSYETEGCSRHGVLARRTLPMGAESTYEYASYRRDTSLDAGFALLRRRFVVNGTEAVWEYGRDPIHFDGIRAVVSPATQGRDDLGCSFAPIIIQNSSYHFPLGGLGPDCTNPDLTEQFTQASNPPRVFEVDPDGNLTIYYLYNSFMDQPGLPRPELYGTTVRIEKIRGPDTHGIPVSVKTHVYEHDFFDFPDDDPYRAEPLRPVNIRKAATKELLLDDGGIYTSKSVIRSDFDGFGRFQRTSEAQPGFDNNIYRQTRESSLVAQTAPETSLIQIEGGTTASMIQALKDRWIVTPVSSTELRAGDTGPILTRSRTVLFDAWGRPREIRDYEDPTGETEPLITRWTHNSQGALASESVETVVNGETITRGTHFELDAAGHALWKRFGDLPWKAFERDIDLATGLVKSTTTPAGVRTAYTYDDLGRLTSIAPPVEKPTAISYPDLHRTTVLQGSGDNRIESRYHYDDAGRLLKHEKINSKGTFDFRTYVHDTAGRKVFESEWVAAGTREPLPPTRGTTYEYRVSLVGTPGPPPRGSDLRNYVADPLGRLTRVTRADGAVTEYAYEGLVKTVTVKDLNRIPESGQAVATGQPEQSVTVFRNDGLGRLVHVDAPEGTDADYTYDERDNLVRVELGTQTREFAYDSLGRLVFESHPENGVTTYEAFLPTGQPLAMTDAAGEVTTFMYDEAGRIIEERRVGAAQPRATYEYDDNNLTRVLSYAEDGAFELRRDLIYGGLDGRLSSERTIFFDPDDDAGALTTRYQYDTFGFLFRIDYPEWGGHQPTKVIQIHTNGFLGEVWDLWDLSGRAYVRHIDYNPAGGMQSILFGNDTRTDVPPDARNRPSRIVVQAFGGDTSGSGGWMAAGRAEGSPEPLPRDLMAQVLQNSGEFKEITLLPGGPGGGPPRLGVTWDSGTYAYDGGGNIIGIGPDTYAYDAVSRLVGAHVAHPPGMMTSYTNMTYSYDAFGNMTRRTRSIDGGSTFTWTFTHGPGNHLQHLAFACGLAECNRESDYTYDAVGNLTGEINSLSSLPRAGYLFDTAGRLRQARDGSGATRGAYGYDHRGYRIRKRENGTDTFYVRDLEGRVLSEFQRPVGSTAPPTWDRNYVYALGKAIALVKNEKPVAPQEFFTSRTINGSIMDVTLTWRKGDESDILGYRLYRRNVTLGGVFELLAVGGYYSVHQDDAGDPAIFKDAGLPLDTFEYYVVTVDTAFFESAPSRHLQVAGSGLGPVFISWREPGAVVSGDRSLTLHWDVAAADQADLLGYNVHRRIENSGHPWEQVNGTLLLAPDFVDTNLVNGTSYEYAVAVRTSTDPAQEPTVLTDLRAGTPVDAAPPATPTNARGYKSLTAGGYDILWSPSNAVDLAEYRLYHDGGGTLLQTVPAATTTANIPASYSGPLILRAVDDDGLESVPAVVSVLRLTGSGSVRINEGAFPPPPAIHAYGTDRILPTTEPYRLHYQNGSHYEYGLPMHFYGAELQLTFPGWSPGVPCPAANLYRISPGSPDWVAVNSDPITGNAGEGCVIYFDDKYLDEPAYTYVATLVPSGGSEQYGDSQLYTYAYAPNEIMGQYAYGAKMAHPQDASGNDDPLGWWAIEPAGGTEIGAELAGNPNIVTWKKSLHPDVVGYRIWVRDHQRTGTDPETGYPSWQHLADVPAWQNIHYDYDAPCNWPVKMQPGVSPPRWNLETCILFTGNYPGCSSRPDPTAVNYVTFYHVEGLTHLEAPLDPPSETYRWTSGASGVWGEWYEEVRAVRLCDGECPVPADACELQGCHNNGCPWEVSHANPPEVIEPTLARSRTWTARPPRPRHLLEAMPAAVTRRDIRPDATVQWLHTDHLGSTRVITNEKGSTVARYKYLPFGEEYPRAGQDTYNTHRFTGHERDTATGLDYMLARYYGPESLFRFMSVDPALDSAVPELPQSWNRYTYVQNNPINANDPDGRIANWLLGAGIGAAVGGLIETGSQLWESGGDFSQLNGRDIAAAAAGGAATGALAGATLGLSLMAETGVMGAAAVGAGSSIVGGAVDRGLDSSSKTAPLDVEAMAIDAALGGIGSGVGDTVQAALKAASSRAVQAAERQLLRQKVNVHPSDLTTPGRRALTQKLQKAAAELRRIETTGRVAGNVVGSKTAGGGKVAYDKLKERE